MFRKHETIPSRVMERPVHLWRFGHFGQPVLIFPSASGMAHEWDAHGGITALSSLIDAGKIKLYCTESNVAEAWTRKENPPEWKIGRHRAFERYVVEELVPFIRADCRSESIRIAAAGSSLGAYYAANFALKFPAVFGYALCLSGRYDVSWLTNGFNSQDIYFNNPMAYLPNLSGVDLEKVRRHTHLVLVCGQGRWEDGNVEETIAFAEILRRKGISHQRDIWGRDVSHQWEWWNRQALYHLSRAFG